MCEKKLSFDVLVLGGGVVGLSAALAMGQRGYSVALIDAGPLTTDTSHLDLRVYALNYASQMLLQELGVWSHVNPKRLAPYQRMHVWDAVSQADIKFDSREIAAANLGVIIEESVLKEALLQQIATQPQVSLFSECLIDTVHTEETHHIKIAGAQKTWSGQLLMIAEGANSLTRQKLTPKLTQWFYQQHALVAAVETERPHLDTAYQVFHPKSTLAFLPLAQPHQCSIVWSTEPSEAKNLMMLPEQQFNAALTEAFAQKLGTVNVISKRHQFPLHMRHVTQYTGPRWMLLGDAAHTIHPLAGLGLNLGLADVRCWIKCLQTNPHSGFSLKTLGAYQRERKHAVWQTILLIEAFKRVFNTTHAPLVALRSLGLGLCSRLTPLKRLFIEHAQG